MFKKILSIYIKYYSDQIIFSIVTLIIKSTKNLYFDVVIYRIIFLVSLFLYSVLLSIFRLKLSYIFNICIEISIKDKIVFDFNTVLKKIELKLKILKLN